MLSTPNRTPAGARPKQSSRWGTIGATEAAGRGLEGMPKGKSGRQADPSRGRVASTQRVEHHLGDPDRGPASRGAPPPQWPLWVAVSSTLGILLGVAAIALSLLSVSISTGRMAAPQVPAAQTSQPRPAIAPSPPPAFQAAAPTALPRASSLNTPAPMAASKTAPEVLARRTKGSPSAPIVIDEWFDYQCPACRTVATRFEPELV